MADKSIELFFSYAHEDEPFKDELLKHLRILQRQGVISTWHDRMIAPGSDWAKDINQYLGYVKRMRSDHSRERGDEGRPVQEAFNDAQRARPADVFIQEDKRYVVRGQRGREHIFESNGELVTSLVRPHKAHLRKIQRGERRPITEAEFTQFKAQF